MERRLRVPGARRRLHPVRIVEVNAQLIHGVVADNRQLFGAVVPGDVVLRQQRKQLWRILTVDQRIEEDAIIKQIVNLGGAHVVSRR